MSLESAAARLTRPAVFGEPHETGDGTTVITVVRGSRAVGVFAVRDGAAHWEPAEDDTLIALFGIAVGLAATILSLAAVIRRPPWPDLTAKVMQAFAQQPRR
jgi:hypothetical protein